MSVFSDLNPSEWIAHNDLAFAIRDRFPVTRGHSLVITRDVVADWWQATDAQQAALMALVETVKVRLDAEFAPDGYNVGFNAGSAAGQTIDHLHVHVIPRYDGDMDDPRGGVRHVIPTRGNYLVGTPSLTPTPASSALLTSSEGRFKLELLRCLLREDLDQIDLLISFIMRSGVRLIADHLDEALARGAKVRLLTTDYLQITDTAALGYFLDRTTTEHAGNLQARVFSDPSTSFHPKAYLFSSSVTGEGRALVGSSNLSESGIARGIEWNLETRGVGELIEAFDRLWVDERSVPLTAGWLSTYESTRRARTSPGSADNRGAHELTEVALGESLEAGPEPWSVQSEALAALEATRIEGHSAGLVVMATGLGKTWVSAFDSARPQFRRVLFIAHREEILNQARDVFRQIRPGGSFTMFTGAGHDQDGEVTFASVQSLVRHLDEFKPDTYDYVVIDEFHHAAAPSYRQVIAHFRPQFLLGLTATPDRADAADLLALCTDNLVYDCGLVEGINRGLLATFTYRAIRDVADYEHIPWRSGRFDPEQLTAELATVARANQVFDEWIALEGPKRRSLGFCCTIAHAEFMAEHFRSRGVAAVAVHSGVTSAPRTESLDRLAAGDLPVIFTVDLFNEGLDVPAVDLVLLLRPTESPVVFFQQLGRGLRRTDDGKHLHVVDLVGNHRSFLLKARLLLTLAGLNQLTEREAVDRIAEESGDFDGLGELPEGCSIIVDTEVVDLLAELVGPLKGKDRLLQMVREWVDSHDGVRPSALEAGVAWGKAFSLKSQGGWFGFLDDAGLLDDDEGRVFALAREFFEWIEHGNYTKSYKLVTLNQLARTGQLRRGAPIDELADACRWAVFQDPRLRADLDNVTSAFADVSSPTRSEWLTYWRTNPVAALCRSQRGSEPWFIEEAGELRLGLEVPHELGACFDAMVAELVEYRLHRYLIQQQARKVGESRKVVRDGVEIDATITVESTEGRPTSVVVESAGGTKGSPNARNVDYVAGFDVLLQRLADAGIVVLDVYVDSTKTQDLALADRRLDPGAGLSYPLDLKQVDDLIDLRKQLLRSMTQVGRTGTKGGGNPRRRTRLVINVPDTRSAARVADDLATGISVHPSAGDTPLSAG